MRQNILATAKSVVAILFFLFLIGYSYTRASNLIFGPQITIQTPENGQLFPDDLITISGTASNVSRLYLNDHQIFTDETGTFREELLLQYGYNIIEITALDRFGKERRKILRLVYQ